MTLASFANVIAFIRQYSRNGRYNIRLDQKNR